MTTINTTVEDLVKAFTKWDERYRENPLEFQNEAYRLLYETAETFGDECTAYLLELLDEVTTRQ